MARGMLFLMSSGRIVKPQSHRSRTTSPAFELSFNRRNQLASHINGREIHIGSEHTSLGFMNDVEGCSEYRPGDEVELFSVWMEPETFNGLLKAVSSQTGFNFTSFLEGDYSLRQFRTDERENQILTKMERLLKGGEKTINTLLLEGYVLELMSLNLERLLGGDGDLKGQWLTESDRESMYEARDILLNRLDNPPSLVELSRAVHMNDCKLKSSFKYLFGKTVYGYVREQRLVKAFTLLSDGRHTVSQTAQAVGYSSVSHFSQIFQKEYGLSPREMLKKKTDPRY